MRLMIRGMFCLRCFGLKCASTRLPSWVFRHEVSPDGTHEILLMLMMRILFVGTRFY